MTNTFAPMLKGLARRRLRPWNRGERGLAMSRWAASWVRRWVLRVWAGWPPTWVERLVGSLSVPPGRGQPGGHPGGAGAAAGPAPPKPPPDMLGGYLALPVNAGS